ncbi:SdrD B-like domain-containing protein [Fibrella forsythiae]|uniref:Cna B-type domain-containing protein n=1 Tax=Fibrella forsythiae TaxID=2817061 RepID=A0ABS3JDU1_9BACT|nr:SdrD B-like domain-containing protein [Fibrella forsythiae]MBO0948157.1 Cna B-type domain-containing protein [Fibrella forsythiae]
MLLFLAGILPTALQAQTISGTVYRDFNSNGVYDTAPASTTFTELGLAGIEVRLFNAAGVNITPGLSVTTSATGSYAITPTQASGPYRVEFTIPTSLDHFYSGAVNTSQGTSIQFVASAPATVNFAVNYPKDYCQSSPDLAVACFVSGDPLATGSTVASDDAIVTVPYGIANASTASPSHLANASEVGSVWGAAYQRTSKKLFTAAFLKRHVGLGQLGLGGIYTTNITTTPTSTTYADLETLGIDLGASLLGTRVLPANGTVSNNDATAFNLIGKIGLGGVALSDDESKLYVIDLYNKKLLILNIGNPAKSSLTAADIQQVTLPTPTCVGGVARPFAVNVGNGKVYVGIVCSGENSVNSGNANLDGYVYEMDPATNVFNSTPILTIPLDYTKGRMHTGHPEMGNTWSPWASSFAQLFRGDASTAGARIGRAQPMLSNIAFTDNGDMLLAFMDRGGHQLGYRNRNTTDTKATPDTLFNGYISGDLLRARYNGSAWVMESNGRVAATSTQAQLSGAGTSNSQGPGGGEFYANDVYADNTGDLHQETIEGGIAVIPGTNHVVATVMDPLTIWSGGFSWFNNTNGDDTKRYQIYLTVGTGANPATYGKANGLGVIAAVCDPAPIQIGNRVWRDVNNNGIQDPGEPALAGVAVLLKGPGLPTGGISVTTNSSGEYYFSNRSATNATGFANSLSLTYGGSYSLTFPTSTSAGTLLLSTKPNSATGTNPDQIDTDPNVAGLVSFTLGLPGQNDFTYDAAYFQPASLGDYTFDDANKDGIQNAGDTPLVGVTVTLYQNGSAVATTTTNASGLYSFTGLTPGTSNSYSVGFTAPAGYTATISNVGSDTADSDPDPATGITAPVTLTAGENNPTLDAGFYLIPASLGDYTFVDANKDGIQNAGDTPLPGVTVTLFQNGSAVATTTTNASGLYSFTGLTPGTSNSYSVGFTTPTGYKATISNVGSDTADSDASPATGNTQSVTLAPGEHNPTLDAGFYLIPASLGDYAFVDANKDGIQNAGDTPLPGVTVTLYQNGSAVATTTTNASGLYSFTGLTPGTSNSYVVGFTPPAGYTTTITNVGSDTADSDASVVTGNTQSVTLAPGENNPTLDAGFYLIPASLGDYAFVDTNKDGIQNAGDVPLVGVTVTLYQNGSAVATTTTDASGLYSFTGLTPGTSNSYSVGFTPPAGYTTTISNVGSDTADSDADPITGNTQSVTLAPGEHNPTLDAGFFLPTASLGNFVFEDVNKDGLQDAGDISIPGAVVTLLQSGTVAGTTTTTVDGLYSFTGLTPGLPYSVSFTTPAGFSATTPKVGSDDTIDSDPVAGVTAPVTLSVNENNTTLDAGFVRPAVTYSIAKTVSKSRVAKGEIVTYTISLTNTSATTATNVIVTDAFSSSGLTVIGSGSASVGSFVPSLTGGLWTIPTLAGGQVATLSFQAQVNTEGLVYNVATAPGGTSTTATACLTVPFHVCENTPFEFLLSTPTSFSTYQWSLNGTPIPGATSSTLSVTAIGEYTVSATNSAGCPDGSCCPFVIIADPAPSLTATAVAASCTGATPLNDAKITLVGSSTNAVSYNVSVGSSFTASTPLFATDQPLSGLTTGSVLVANQHNPALAPGTTYTIRVYSAEGCFSDVVVVIPPAQCQCPPVKCVPVTVKRVVRR